MWTIKEVSQLMYDVIPKWRFAEYLSLERPYTRYTREEFAPIICDEANRNKEFSDMLIYKA